ncbi:SRPBCC family protein [Actinomadura barringtoniae]|uniref:SRPBCC family protein n=2 Tax=Actinomadura barringtoniae TaxID=1427535 RepID=A0A939T6D9_9ACTN|nr:SRPBCC family protein [Actinomadura barringtoniae]
MGRIAKNLPTDALKNVHIPGGRTAGAAGGALVGMGAAVAATKAASRLNERRHSNGGESSSGSSSPARTEDKDADADASDQVEAQDEQDQDEQQDEGQEGEKKQGFFARLFKRGKGGGQTGGKKLKVTNIIEEVDVGAPRRLVYDQWTRFQDFPTFMKKVVSVDQADDEKLHWKAKIFWSNRTWESTIVEQLPDKRIVWRSKAPKGHVDGAVSFHRVAPNLTRVLLVLEYHPQGLFERTGNLWRAQGRRARLELKHFRRHVMTQSLLNPEDVEGWRGEIRDSEVVKTHDEAVEEEEKALKEGGEDRYEETFDSDADAKSDTKADTKTDAKTDAKEEAAQSAK